MKTVIAIQAIILVIFMVSCENRRYVYASPPPNNPIFTKKGESKIAAYGSFGGSRGWFSGSSHDSSYNYGYDLQGAYAFSKHWAATISYGRRKEMDNYYRFRINKQDPALVGYQRKMIEVGAGYFVATDKSSEIMFNLYGGIGNGDLLIEDNSERNNTPVRKELSAKISKYYLQPSINFGDNRYFNMGLLARITALHFTNINSNYTNSEIVNLRLDQLNKPLHFFVEPSVIFSFGAPEIPWVKLGGSGTFNMNLFSPVSTRGLNCSIGLNFDVSKISGRSSSRSTN